MSQALLAEVAIGPAYWPLLVLAVSVALIVVLITALRVHAFLALTLAAFTAGLLSWPGTLPGEAEGKSHWVQAIELSAGELGVTAGKIAIVIGLAALIGMCLMESGAADKVVRRFLAVFGEKRAGFAICVSGYILSIPIFFDTFFMLLLPLAQAMALRTGRDYVLYLLAICCGGVVTHSLVAPHPGPLAMAEALKLDLGLTVWAGIVIGVVPVLLSWQVAKWLNRRYPVPLRETAAGSPEDLRRLADRPESELPGFVMSILPIILPIALISLASTFAAIKEWKSGMPVLYAAVEFAGNRNVALLIGAILASVVLVRGRGLSFRRVEALMEPPLRVAATVILITSAGGAFGLMLKHAGVGRAVQDLVASRDINLLWLAWLLAAVIRVAQGSATVAMLTTSAMVYPLMTTSEGVFDLPYHPVYVFMAIGFGAMIMSWMNDSGFWVISKLSGMTERETLRTWTVIATVNSVVGVTWVWVISKLLPFAPVAASVAG
jgi:GntP family gluconate:H+ symporter